MARGCTITSSSAPRAAQAAQPVQPAPARPPPCQEPPRQPRPARVGNGLRRYDTAADRRRDEAADAFARAIQRATDKARATPEKLSKTLKGAGSRLLEKLKSHNNGGPKDHGTTTAMETGTRTRSGNQATSGPPPIKRKQKPSTSSTPKRPSIIRRPVKLDTSNWDQEEDFLPLDSFDDGGIDLSSDEDPAPAPRSMWSWR